MTKDSMKRRFAILERGAAAMNSWLLLVALGLGMLDLSIYIALHTATGSPSIVSAGAAQERGKPMVFPSL